MGSLPFPIPSKENTTIARGRFQRRDKETGKRLRINERIRISPVRLIDHNDEQVGVVETNEALNMARDAGLDLVEVAPNSRPPVCRIMDYGKWKYQQRKKEQKAKSHSKQAELKEIRFRPKTDDNDRRIKVEKSRAFMADGHKVQFTMIFRGREMAHRNIGLDIFKKLAAEFEDLAKVEVPPRIMGRRMTMLLAPLGKAAKAKSKPKEEAAADKPPAAAPTEPQPSSTGS